MALIVAIDTAVDTAGVCLSKDNQVLGFLENERQKDHASWIHTAIRRLMNEAGLEMKLLNAVAVTAGPGSYTGLRVGMATAKGLCYALKIPLIAENTLKVMAYAVKQEDRQTLPGAGSPVLICPMIDARRMEVFTALFNDKLEEIIPSAAKILDPLSFNNYLQNSAILFCGNGNVKWKGLTVHNNAYFSSIRHNALHLAALAAEKLSHGQFSDLVYAEPLYLKNFYTPGDSN